MKIQNPKNRQGITLLFVISMIVLFLLMGTTFVVISNDYFKAARKRGQANLHEVDGSALVRQAFYEIVRGPSLKDQSSPLRGHDLLSDMYGYGIKAKVAIDPVVPNPIPNPIEASIPATKNFNDPLPSGGQLFEIRLQNVKDGEEIDFATSLRIDDKVELSDKPGFYNNQILTFLNGPAKGVSSRIYDYQIGNSDEKTFVIFLDAWSDSFQNSKLSELKGSDVVINRLPFAGLGSGSILNNQSDNRSLGSNALKPNRVGENFEALTETADLNSNPVINGGYLPQSAAAVESYDAPDFQNMFLSGYERNGEIIPSFHRPFLASQGGGSGAGGPANRHMFSAFDGANLDVDNDNDGTMDSIWMDTGMPAQADREGKRFKPLVSYRVVDMDGRVNLNVAGNLANLELGQAFSSEGYGPAEISLYPWLTQVEYGNLLRGDGGYLGRYGENAVPGRIGSDNWLAVSKQFGYPSGNLPHPFIGNLFASSAFDGRGRFPVGTPDNSQFTDPNFNTFNNGLPVKDFSSVDLDFDGLNESPYESNFGPGQFSRWEVGDDDTPFSATELERVLRPYDVDSRVMSRRLHDLVPSLASSHRDAVTTDSYEVPMAAFFGVSDAGNWNGIVDVLRGKLTGGGTNAQKDPYVRFLLPPELMDGLKMDINRSLGNGVDNSVPPNGVIDEIAEANSEGLDLNNNYIPNDEQNARSQFARHLYILVLLACEDEIDDNVLPVEDFRRSIAQWAVNVVDFRDPDSIMTRFQFDPNPWVDSDNDGNPWEVNNVNVVWGAERPELLLTESFAHHDRRTEDLDAGGGKVADGDDDDYDSRLIPQSSAFIEVYNPWTQDANNQVLPKELTNSGGDGVELQKRTPGADPVWRIGIKREEADDGFLRSIYFVDAAANPINITNGGEQFYSTLANDLPPLAPGRFAVVGSAGNSLDGIGGYRTTFGRLSAGVEGTAASLKLNETRSITLNPTGDANDTQVLRRDFIVDPENAPDIEEVTYATQATAVVIDGPRSLSISDPEGGYTIGPNEQLVQVGDGEQIVDAGVLPVQAAPRDEPLDANANANDFPAIWNNGTTDEFRYAYLQRLANPLEDWDQDTNPYITIDAIAIDLLAFNGVQTNADNGNPNPQEQVGGVNVTISATDFDSLERGESSPGQPNMLFRRDFGNQAAQETVVSGDGHNLSFEFKESFGRTNRTYQVGPDANPPNYTEKAPFAWLTWNNRPFVSQYELANVPHSSPEFLTQHFSLANNFDPYTTNSPDGGATPLSSKFGHLLNFYRTEASNASNAPNAPGAPGVPPLSAKLYRLFDYTEVPSRYVGVEKWLNPNVFTNIPFNYVRNNRYPGKININTIPNKKVYDALMGQDATKVPFADFNQSRWDSNSFRPYRNTNESSFVPLVTMVEDEVDLGLFRRKGDGNPLFEDTAQNRTAYYRNNMRQRLGNLVTTRSSVFAIWVTVGYFEINESGELGAEIGSDTGDVKRNRGFFMFDRSIPMAFEPGKNHNIEKGVLVETIIE